jgi:hypothetical protein
MMVFIGLILACNEGEWFPWINFVGVALVAAAPMWWRE